MGPLFSRLSQETARSYALVLTAMGIPSRTVFDGLHWSLSVTSAHRRTAIRAISLYLKENPPQQPRRGFYPLSGPRSFSAIYVTGVLALIHGTIVPGYEHQVFVNTLGADAGKILDGDLYRCVTALLLHADWVHLLGNLVALTLFGTVVAVSYGWGMGWLLILSGGAAGNLITALWYQQYHLSVGASTAVFAGVGLCSVLNLRLRALSGSRSWRSWMPLAGGVALLGFLGTSPRSDLMAHLAGFLSGLALGWIDLRFRRYRDGPLQFCAACIAIGAIAATWCYGVFYSG
jgi:rhomboid protease GluP